MKNEIQNYPLLPSTKTDYNSLSKCIIFLLISSILQSIGHVFCFLKFRDNKTILCGCDNGLFCGDWGLGIGDWGLGIGDWGLGPIPNPQSPIPKNNTII